MASRFLPTELPTWLLEHPDSMAAGQEQAAQEAKEEATGHFVT